MPGWRSEKLSIVGGFVAAWVLILCLIRFETSEAAQESLVNCNEVMLEDRCACNERILRALGQSRAVVVDPTAGGNPGETHAAITMQQLRQQRLRTFYAPDCKNASSPERLPLSEPHTTDRRHGSAIEKHLQPILTNTIDGSNHSELIVARKLLVGRWEGWQTLFGGRPSSIFFHVISVGNPLPLQPLQPAPFVKACSDQGMVFGRLRDGYVELPRSDSSGGAYSIRLWRSSAPHSRDLEGVVLLEVRPGEVLVAGLVSLSRSVKFDWTVPPSSYFCQDRDLEEQRKNAQEEETRTQP
jgi:hypothetical protein